jgi:hypothetical protein
MEGTGRSYNTFKNRGTVHSFINYIVDNFDDLDFRYFYFTYREIIIIIIILYEENA